MQMRKTLKIFNDNKCCGYNFKNNFSNEEHNSKEEPSKVVKLIRAQGECLGIRSRRRTW